MNKVLHAISFFAVNIVAITLLHAGGDFGGSSGAKQSASLEPSYAALEEGVGKYSARIYDEATIVQLDEISFFGHATVGGIRKETDDSMNKLDLADIREIIIKDSDYDSKRYTEKGFCLGDVISTMGSIVRDLLIPKHVIICGKEKDTGLQKSWFLSKVNRLVIEQPAVSEEVSAKKYVEKIFKEDVPSKVVEPIKEEVSGVKKDIDAMKRDVIRVEQETAEMKQQADEASREIAQVKKELEQQPKEQKEIVVVKEVQKAVTPVDVQVKPLAPERKTVGDAFMQLVNAIVDFVKSIFNFFLQFFPH